MLLFTSSLAKPKLTFIKLSDCLDHLSLAAKWAENEWGYIRNKGVEFREEVMLSLSNHVYIGFYADQPIAMFALLPHQIHEELKIPSYKLPTTRELMYVYVEKKYRGFGLGNQIIEEAKRLAKNNNANLILLDTLKPNLNRMYQKHGAEFICEGQLFSHSTDVMMTKL